MTMTKTPITWIGLLQQKMKLKGKGTSIKDVAKDAKKDWENIKLGKDPKYIKGDMKKTMKSKTMKSKTMKSKTRKSKTRKSKTRKSKTRKSQMGGSNCSGSTLDAAYISPLEQTQTVEPVGMSGGKKNKKYNKKYNKKSGKRSGKRSYKKGRV